MSTVTETALIVGASRGLGLGLAHEYARRGWQVIGTVRGAGRAGGLSALADATKGRVRVEMVDITMPEQVAGLRERLAGERLDLLFVNAGISTWAGEAAALGPTEAFIRLMVTNAWGPLQVIEACADLVPANGVIAAMSSGLGSVTNNTGGGWENLSRQQGGPEHDAAQFCAPAGRRAHGAGGGAGLGQNGHGWDERGARCGDERARHRRRHRRPAGAAGRRVCRLPGT